MGLYHGSLACTRFTVHGKPPRGFREQALRVLRDHVFMPLDPASEDVERAGWCAPGDGLDLDIRDDKVFLGGWVAVGLRIDRWRLPAAVVRAHVEAEVRRQLEKGGADRMGRQRKSEIKAEVVTRLRRKSIPSMRVVDVAWELDARVVRVWSQSRAPVETFRELFERCFGLEVTPDSPWRWAEECVDAPLLELLASAEPTRLGMAPLTVTA